MPGTDGGTFASSTRARRRGGAAVALLLTLVLAVQLGAVAPAYADVSYTAVFEFDLPENLDRRDVVEWATELNDRNASLGDTLEEELSRNDLELPGGPADYRWPEFDGRIVVTNTGLSFTVEADEATTDVDWGLIGAGVAGIAVWLLVRVACTAGVAYLFPALTKVAVQTICAPLAAFLGSFTTEAIVIKLNGLDRDWRAWVEAVGLSVAAAVGPAVWESYLGPWLNGNGAQALWSVSGVLQKTAGGLWWFGSGIVGVVRWLATFLSDNAHFLIAALQRGAARARSATGVCREPVDGVPPGWSPLGQITNGPSDGAQTRYPDIDGDGDADRVIVADGRLHGWRNAGCDSDGERVWLPMGDIAPESATPDDLDRHPLQLLFGDLDGDDRDDFAVILGAHESPTGYAAMRVWRNESSVEQTGWAQPRTVANDLGYVGTPTFVDIDGDGDDDLLIMGRYNFVTGWENRASGLPTPGDWRKIQDFGHPAEGPTGQVHFADITGDGRADVVVVEYTTGDVVAWENLGGPWDFQTGWRPLDTIRSGDPFNGTIGAFADLDVDRVADFLLFNSVSRGIDGWLLPRYGPDPPGPGQPGQPGGPGDLPPGTLPAYHGGQPQPQVDGRLLQNSNFTGTDKPWWVNAGMTPSVNGGVFCVTAPASTNPWDVLVGHNSIYLPGGGSYTLRFRARTGITANPLVQLAPFDNPSNVTYLNKGLTTGPSWKHFEYTFAANVAAEYVLAQLQFRLGRSAQPYEFCMDDVSLTGEEYAYQADRGPAVKVNQHGYLPDGPKRATVVTDATAPLQWALRPSTGGTVATGTTTPAGFDGSAAAAVHTIDFSGFSATGRFQLVVGGQASHPFDIRSDLYASLRTDSMRLFYTNRSGIAIDGGIAGAAYARPAGHVAASPGGGDTRVPCQTPKPYVDNWTCDYTLDVTGGWYDAGDHGKYVVNGGIATYQLLSAWERALAQGSSGPLGDSTLAVPERGNGVPDILDEARWNLEFMLTMQVPDGRPLAGMVHHKVHDESWTGPPMLPHQDKKKRELHRPSTAATLNLAAVAAQGARLYTPYDAVFAARLRAVAERAYAAARANPVLYAPQADRVGGGPYADSDVSDEYYWAAAQLYLTTRNAGYLDAVRSSRFHTAGAAFSQNGFYWGSVAALAQLDLARFGTGLTEQAQIRTWVRQAADRLISFQRAERFGQTYTPSTGRYDWGSNASILNNQVVLATAYDLTGNRAYADAVFEAFDYLLGRNALGQSYITGYGSNDARNQHSRWYARSFDATLPNPLVGSVSGGPNSSLQDPLAASWLHSCAPQLCYVDNLEAWSVNEITINWNSALAWVSAFAADVAGS
ncbi:glycoside hydrolase family 9 protein [Solwaraspora sp. WMMB335]|uniref:glycoside hydrolase family 9 protein n=1 Tax=Solwaraspora sp. WMMB335 TaxID=3404118 RepID=UPI003B94648C